MQAITPTARHLEGTCYATLTAHGHHKVRRSRLQRLRHMAVKRFSKVLPERKRLS